MHRPLTSVSQYMLPYFYLESYFLFAKQIPFHDKNQEPPPSAFWLIFKTWQEFHIVLTLTPAAGIKIIFLPGQLYLFCYLRKQ